MRNSKVVIFTCNWNAYSALESAGKDHRLYPVDVRPIRVMCLGRLHPGLILKAFEHGAAGVMMLGCAPDECHYDFGVRGAEQVYELSKALIGLLGYNEQQLQLDYLTAGNGKFFAEKVHEFIADLNGDIRKS